MQQPEIKRPEIKTIANLESAFAGESMAHIKYRYFAKIARAAGDEDTARIFEETAWVRHMRAPLAGKRKERRDVAKVKRLGRVAKKFVTGSSKSRWYCSRCHCRQCPGPGLPGHACTPSASL